MIKSKRGNILFKEKSMFKLDSAQTWTYRSFTKLRKHRVDNYLVSDKKYHVNKVYNINTELSDV